VPSLKALTSLVFAFSALGAQSLSHAAALEPSATGRYREILPIDKEADAALATELGGTYEFVHTDHFSIAHAGDEAGARYRGEILESLYASFAIFCEEQGLAIEIPKALLSVTLFPTRQTFLAHTKGLALSKQVEGVYLRSANRAYFFDAVRREKVRDVSERVRKIKADLGRLRREIEAMPQGSEVTLKRPQRPRHVYTREAALRAIAAEGRRVGNESGRYRGSFGQFGIEAMSHEGAHQLSFNLGVLPSDLSTPLWVVEGLATFFEPSRHGYLLEPGEVHWRRLEALRGAHATGQTLALEKLLVDDTLFRHDDTASQAYDEAWSLVHFLVAKRPGAFVGYLRALHEPSGEGDDRERVGVFTSRFGSIEAAEREWRAHIASLGAPEQQATANASVLVGDGQP
jgi:hypothetical protein